MRSTRSNVPTTCRLSVLVALVDFALVDRSSTGIDRRSRRRRRRRHLPLIDRQSKVKFRRAFVSSDVSHECAATFNALALSTANSKPT